jgi:hypothetical protein
MDKFFSMFSPKTEEKTEETPKNNTENIPSKKQNIPSKKNVSTKKKPTLSISSADESVDFSIHFKNKILTIYLYINKKGLKESWKAKLNETEMNKLLYNLFLIFSNPEPYHEQIQAVYPNQQLEQVLHVNPNPSLNNLEQLSFLLSK